MSTKILFITPYPFDEAPSQRFRFEQYFDLLKKHNFEFSIKPFLSYKAWHHLYGRNKLIIAFYLCIGYLKRFFLLVKIFPYDYIFIHREASPMGPPLFEYIIAKIIKKKIIYDFDDAIWMNDPSEEETLLAKLKWKSKVAKICSWSYKISVGNQYLGEFAKRYNGNVTLNVTTIDTKKKHNPKLYDVKRTEKQKFIIGWTGTHSTLHYLNPILPLISELEKRFRFTFLVIANKNPEYTLKSFQFKAWNKDTEIDDLMEIDIGLMPLSSEEWSKGKCGFKALQYLALKKPALASPIGVNLQIIKHQKTGYLCKNITEWRKNLLKVLADRNHLQIMGGRGRDFVKKHYSVKSNSGVFLSLFT